MTANVAERVRLKRVDEVDRVGVQALRLTEAQLAFVSPIQKMLDEVADKSDEVPFAIVRKDEIVGFCIINFNPAATAHYCDGPDCCGLEGFFIDVRRQGQGLGGRAVAALRILLRREYPTYARINLTVNCKNSIAVRTYLKHGFQDTERLYHGGRSGPQHILTMTLR